MTTFFVAGLAVPQGSARAFVRNGRAHITSTSGANLKHWRSAIQFVAQQHFDQLLDGAVRVDIEFVLSRPKSLAKKHVRPWHTKAPDADKILRAALDAMSGVCYRDDSQVAVVTVSKVTAAVGEQTGAHITVTPLGDNAPVQHVVAMPTLFPASGPELRQRSLVPELWDVADELGPGVPVRATTGPEAAPTDWRQPSQQRGDR